MKYLKAALLCSVVSAAAVAFVLFLFIKIFGNEKDVDLNGNTPELLLDRFLADCKRGDFEKAQSYWTPESSQRFPGLFEWCKELGELDLDYGPGGNGKCDTIFVIVADVVGEENNRRHFYFEVRDSNWHLHWPVSPLSG